MTLGSLLADSIRVRLLALAALLTSAALLAGYLVIAAVLETFILNRFDAETAAMAETIMATAHFTEDGRLEVGTLSANPRFMTPLSGWYWQLSQDGRIVAKSHSLFDSTLPITEGNPTTPATATGPQDQPLRLTQSPFTLPNGDGALLVSVTAPMSEIQASLSDVRRPLAISLAALGLALALASVVQVSAGLRSLHSLGRDLRQIRDGKADTLPLPPVSELRPIASEINELLNHNRQILVRSREHVGNLAHSLKTPLAALTNSLPADHDGQGLISRMDRQIDWHLRRARSSAAPRLLGQRTLVAPVIDDILMVLRGPVTDAGISLQVECPPDLAFAGERQDLEELIGNLTENAVKWARTTIRIHARRLDNQASAAQPVLQILIEDDGPGMSESQHELALTRGRRLDETGPPGTGLGLAIVADLAALHGGNLVLERSGLGGLCASLSLPA